jgi:hypothetical protein
MRHLQRSVIAAACLVSLVPTGTSAQQAAAQPSSAQHATAQPAVAAGRVKVAAGTASIVRAGQVLAAQPGQAVFESDSLRTGADGRIGVTLKDDTRISVGPGSEVRLDTFMYAPENGRVGLALQFIRGMAIYVSGQIAKLAPDSVRLDTPAATLGVRGTTLAVRVSE